MILPYIITLLFSSCALELRYKDELCHDYCNEKGMIIDLDQENSCLCKPIEQ